MGPQKDVVLLFLVLVSEIIGHVSVKRGSLSADSLQ